MWWAIAGVLALGAAVSGPVMSNVEQPQYRVVEQHGDVEIRDYPAMIVAEAEVAGERKIAINAGFRTIADYIFGNNVAAQKVAMTAPVLQQSGETIAATASETQQAGGKAAAAAPTARQAGEKIAMTAPVTQEGDGKTWRVRFIMPATYTMDSLPKPKNPAVTLRQIAARRFAAIRFTGLAGDDSLRAHTATLQAFLAEHHLQAQGAPSYAFYNPPWTLPFMRRNEVLVEIGESR